MFAGLAMAASAAALACGSTAPDAVQLRGNFAATYFVGEAQVTVAVGLHAAAGIVSGVGWTNINDVLMGGAVLSGSYSPPNIQFSFEPRLGGATVWHFIGTVDSQGLSIPGEFALAPGTGFPMTLLPVDTVPTGEYRLTLSNPAQVLSGSAFFYDLDLGQPRLVVALQTRGVEQYSTGFMWDSAALPPTGTFQLSEPGAPEVSFADPSGIEYEYGPGTITIEVAERYVIAGRYTVTVRNPSTGQSRVLEATFSAGCSGARC
jgi:hypothetical protein